MPGAVRLVGEKDAVHDDGATGIGLFGALIMTLAEQGVPLTPALEGVKLQVSVPV